MKRIFSLLVILFFAVLAMTIHLKNGDWVTIEYYFGFSQQLPLALLLICTFLVGLLVGGLIMSVSVFKNKHQVGKAKRQLAKVEKEVENLRAMPIKDDV